MHFATVWTVLFQEPSRYNWLFQYYLRAEGVTLSWVGTGRCLMSMDFTADDYQELQRNVLSAAANMQRDGWWLTEKQQPGREKTMRARLLWEMAGSLIQVPAPVKSFYAEVMRRKHDDHVASHSNSDQPILSPAEFQCLPVLLWSGLLGSHPGDVSGISCPICATDGHAI